MLRMTCAHDNLLEAMILSKPFRAVAIAVLILLGSVFVGLQLPYVTQRSLVISRKAPPKEALLKFNQNIFRFDKRSNLPLLIEEVPSLSQTAVYTLAQTSSASQCTRQCDGDAFYRGPPSA
ncbi:MAG: hypothetical protein RLY57_324 [Candidatus Parcubacteria bacterium]|jgi:hypothetical protein